MGLRQALKEAIDGIFGLDLPIDEWAARGRYRRRGDRRAPAQGGRREEPRRKSAELGAENYPADREDGAPADARPPLARAPRHARASAPGDRLPCLRPARSAQRVQVRGLRPVRRHAGRPARGRDRPAHARRAGAARRAAGCCSPSSCRRWRPITSIRFTGYDELAMADAAIAADGRRRTRALSRSARRCRRARSQTPSIPTTPPPGARSRRNAPCPCGSGKKYKHCHGKHE